MIPVNKWNELKGKLKGDLYTGDSMRLLYATDASAYREIPAGVCRPAGKHDLKVIIGFARRMKLPLIPRTAGTSLAGQVVGSGLVVDVSKYMTRVLELNVEERWVRVEPGVVLDELNNMLEPYGLFFGPETSTSNRCMIGGMVGNNSCGSHSLVYGSTRDHTLEITALLSDGSEAVFGEISGEEFEKKLQLQNLEGDIYRNIYRILSKEENQKEIREHYPDPGIERRNTGYALDLLLESEPFTKGKPKFNFSRLLAGSEGTLAFSTEIKLNLVPLPPPEKALICVHCAKLEDAFKGNLVALKHDPVAVELIDSYILERTKDNISQRKNRFFIQGEPAAILVVELALESREAIDRKATELETALRKEGFGYHFPVVYGSDINKVWALRKAGLGLLSNVPGDAKPVAVIEDTAVNPAVLPEYMHDFRLMLDDLGLDCVYYAHIATGELHLRPVLNLKDPGDIELFHTVALETAKLVKKYRGSLSGEHGDGRLRGEFIPLMLGEHNYSLLEEVKQTWDPEGIFNPGKITGTPRMNTSLRYEPGQTSPEPETIFDFSDTLGLIRAAEQCNGSGDCRKSEQFAGTMCPSYQATRDENATTRARANILREFLTRSQKRNPFDQREIYEIMDLCLSCKGCKSECPSNVDIAKYKAEFLQHYYDANGVPLRTRMIAWITTFNRIGSLVPAVYNFFLKNSLTSGLMKKTLGFAQKRSIPLLQKTTLRRWYRRKYSPAETGRKVYLFADEFTNYNDTSVGISAVKALHKLGYDVVIPEHTESGRTFISKGLLRRAARLAEKNIRSLYPLVSEEAPLIGLEPSAILTFKDEYIDLTRGEMKEKARALAGNCMLFEDFIMREFAAGRIETSLFTTDHRKIRLHGHCHQKSLAGTASTRQMLSLPVNYTVEEIKSGCCGMAGSFGYEAEHYELSMKVGELVLFPEIRKTGEETIIAAPGTSCRHQISDGTGRQAKHPAEVFYESMK